ncbi:four helix bundle protein [candidate division WWE3 bacterium]|uniref:Four helix bundle protein n=1 Tax=candidate division WWE3 bacterium TaxID=2053526 RepID=A0A955LKG3_UNCKA|nr:four helix bundle protein [candidate division WWE3 bacterium]
MKIQKFEELTIWQESMRLVELIYQVLQSDRFKSNFALKNQISRCAVSVPSNIAEGFERENNNEFINFLRISKGSLGECKTQLILAVKLGYITNQNFVDLERKIELVGKQIGSLIKYLRVNRTNDRLTTKKHLRK